MNNHETKITLPKGFLIGAASAAHQVEGNNKKNDWWEFEQMGRLPKSGLAADHYHRYEEDFKIAKELGLNAMRISIEWSRIEPEEGKWVVSEIEHYKKVLRKLKELGMTRMVTLHHFTLPKWLADRGGFETKAGVQAFARFAWFVAHNLGKEIDLWVTINEPEVYCLMSFKKGAWPPFKKSLWTMFRVTEHLIKAHKSAYRAIKEVLPNAQIGIAKNNVYYEPYRHNHFLDRTAAWLANRIGNHYILEKIRKETDFLGLNYYFYNRLKFDYKKGFEEMNKNFSNQLGTLEEPRSDMGWRTYPEGIYYLLKDLKRYHKPVYITENGIANATDDMRERFIREHLYWISKAIDFGTNVRGYFYWSLTDTYEWQDGFGPKFGLAEVNFETQTRVVRDSGRVFEDLTFK